MLPRYKRLLKVAHSLSIIYGTNNIKAHCVNIIETDKTNNIDKMLNTLAYQLHISVKGLNKIQLGNLEPYYKILIAYNESITNKQMLIKYLCAEALESMSLQHVKSFKQDIIKVLNNRTKMSLQYVEQIASRVHMPYKKAFYAFKNSGIKLFDKIETYPVIHKEITNRQYLNNYIWCLSYLKHKTEHWDAKKIGITYKAMYMVIKYTSAKNINKKFKKLNKYYPQLNFYNIQSVLNNHLKPIKNLIETNLLNIKNRTDLLRFLIIYLRLHNNITYRDFCKNNHHTINYINCATHWQLRLWLRIIQHISQMPMNIFNKLLKLKCLSMNYRQLPTEMYFYIDYNQLLNNPNIQPENQAKIQELSNKLSRTKNVITAWIITKAIINRWSHIFDFSASEFIKRNFQVKSNKAIYIQKYSLLTVNNFQELLRNIYKQLMNIQHLETFKNLKQSKYRKLILINNQTIEQVNRKYHPIQRLIDRHRHTFIATFKHTDIKTISSTNNYYKEYYRPVIVLSNIYHNGKLILNHAVMNYTKIFINLHSLQQGDKIKFTAMVYPDGMIYNLNRLLRAKIIFKNNNHISHTVPTDIRALTWYAIKENKAKVYDFTTWGKNYGYIRFCKQQYKLWKKQQNTKGVQK